MENTAALHPLGNTDQGNTEALHPLGNTDQGNTEAHHHTANSDQDKATTVTTVAWAQVLAALAPEVTCANLRSSNIQWGQGGHRDCKQVWR